MKLLIVEDELIIAEDIQSISKYKGHKVTGIAKSAEEAIDSIEKDRPDVIFMDIGLKGKMNGLQLAQLIYDRYGIRVIYLSSFFQKIPEEAHQTSPYAFLIKPVVQEEIMQTLETIGKSKTTTDLLNRSKRYKYETFYSKLASV